VKEVEVPVEEAKELIIDTMKIEAPELEGPKIVGRIELPVEHDQKIVHWMKREKGREYPSRKRRQTRTVQAYIK
jgi:hypothetical protein